MFTRRLSHLQVLSEALPAGSSEHRTPPLLDVDEAVFNILGADWKVRVSPPRTALHSVRSLSAGQWN
jgi:hypothetical protein